MSLKPYQWYSLTIIVYQIISRIVHEKCAKLMFILNFIDVWFYALFYFNTLNFWIWNSISLYIQCGN